MNRPTTEKLLKLINFLNHALVERDNTLKTALLTMLASENLLLVGPPGTAKSLIARKVAKCLADDSGAEGEAGYFEYLLTKFSTPEEIFGPLSISELKADRFKRNTAGYLPSVRMAFLDEIFKASSSILNALLTILNERLYHNGAEVQKVPLQALIAASNELPTGQEELDALYDRFLVRSFVGYVSEDNLPRLLDKPVLAPTLTPLSTTDLAAIRQAAEGVTLPSDIVSAIQKIWASHKQMFKDERRENLSDRRLIKVVGLLRISAATNGRQEVDLSDLLLLKDCLWNHPDSALKVRELVMKTLRTFSYPVQLSVAEQQETRDVISEQKDMAVPTARIGAVVKGYKGSGTEHDPILIENLAHLTGLERPEVGQQGYHFRQTADIDCSELTTWLSIDFQGLYEGQGFSILHKIKNQVFLFEKIENNSQISNVNLVGICLANKINKTKVISCATDVQLVTHAIDSNISCSQSADIFVEHANNCVFEYCQSGRFLISGDAKESLVNRCRSQQTLILGSAISCLIQDCHAEISGIWRFPDTIYLGGIASKLMADSLVRHCLVTGEGVSASGSAYFSGIAVNCSKSEIQQCALGNFRIGSNSFGLGGHHRRLVAGSDSDAKLDSNISLDCHGGESNANGPDGKSVSAAIFTQYYFENNLDWNFENIWQWDDQNNQPQLRVVGTAAAVRQNEDAKSSDMGDLLTQQLVANIWL